MGISTKVSFSKANGMAEAKSYSQIQPSRKAFGSKILSSDSDDNKQNIYQFMRS